MKITKYNQNHIGGSIVKITSDNNDAIIIDYGLNLDGTKSDDIPDLFNVKGIFITHFHYDHIGLLNEELKIPVYVNKKAYDSFLIYANHMNIVLNCNFIFIEPNEEIIINDFKIKGISCSHSAYQSMMYFINVDDRNILHTGDFRLHGIDYNKLDCFKGIKDNLDILITEGTNISNELEAKTEEDLKIEFDKLQDEYKYIFVVTSSTNYERIKMVNDSVRKGRYFLTDGFQAKMIDSWGDRYELGFKDLIYGPNLDESIEKRGFTMLVRPSNNAIDVMNKYKENSVIVYSMWRGYIDMYPRLKEFLGNEYKFIHTSGHISRPDLERFINYLNPKDVMLIHTENEQLLHDLIINSNIIDDKEMEFAWSFKEAKTSALYNEVFDLVKDYKELSVYYLRENFKFSFEMAHLMVNEVIRYRNKDTYLSYLAKVVRTKKTITDIAYELGICLRFAEELLNRYLNQEGGTYV